jgi:hypothetical protein
MLKWRAFLRLCFLDYPKAVSSVRVDRSQHIYYHHEIVSPTVHVLPTNNDLKLGFSGIGALLAALSAASVTECTMEDECSHLCFGEDVN